MRLLQIILSWLEDYHAFLEEYRRQASRPPIQFVQITSSPLNFLRPEANDRRFWPVVQQTSEGEPKE